jgi:hypothetical protein
MNESNCEQSGDKVPTESCKTSDCSGSLANLSVWEFRVRLLAGMLFGYSLSFNVRWFISPERDVEIGIGVLIATSVAVFFLMCFAGSRPAGNSSIIRVKQD